MTKRGRINFSKGYKVKVIGSLQFLNHPCRQPSEGRYGWSTECDIKGFEIFLHNFFLSVDVLHADYKKKGCRAHPRWTKTISPNPIFLDLSVGISSPTDSISAGEGHPPIKKSHFVGNGFLEMHTKLFFFTSNAVLLIACCILCSRQSHE